MALFVAEALSPENHAPTAAQLRRMGHTGPLPVVRQTLIFCPPHLLKSWTDQILAVRPGARVVVLKQPSDLEREGDYFVLSREAAKLGPRIKGLEGKCFRCGSQIGTTPQENAEGRLRCQAEIRRPVNLAARLIEELAVPLALAHPSSLASYFVRGFVRRKLDTERPRPLSLRAVRSCVERMEAAVREAADGTEVEALRLEVRVLFEALRDYAASELLGPVLLRCLDALFPLGRWEGRLCGEPLFTVEPRPRRYPLAKLILRRARRKFDLLILDEAHEANHGDSAQSKAAHRLARLPGVPTLALSGSLMGGYASHLFANIHALSPAFRAEFDREEMGRFVERYGFRKLLRSFEEKDDDRPQRRGRSSDRDLDGRKVIGEAPGVLPTFITRHLLPQAVFVHKSDLDQELPLCRELPSPLAFDETNPLDQKLRAEYRHLQGKLLARIKADRFTQLDGRLFGALGQLPSYLDRATDDLPRFVVAYPDTVGGALVAEASPLPASYRTPKERWLLAKLRECREQGEKVLLFVTHTGASRLPGRLLELVAEVMPGAVFLDTQKVPAADREAWIDRHVIEKEVPLLLVNPNGVRTGLNNLVAFSTAIWYELDLSALTYRQANGRLHRIGQMRPVTIHVPFYAGTAQQIAFELLGQKVSASLQVDGLDLTAALEAAGAGEGAAAALASVMGLGQAIYQRLTKGG